MSDHQLRELERLAKAAPEDRGARYRLRLALVRAGRGDEAGLERGDFVEVDEDETHACVRHPFRGWFGMPEGRGNTGQWVHAHPALKPDDLTLAGRAYVAGGWVEVLQPFDKVTLLEPFRGDE